MPNLIARLRRAAGLKVGEVATGTGISLPRYQNLEPRILLARNRRNIREKDIDAKEIDALARFYSIDSEHLRTALSLCRDGHGEDVEVLYAGRDEASGQVMLKVKVASGLLKNTLIQKTCRVYNTIAYTRRAKKITCENMAGQCGIDRKELRELEDNQTDPSLDLALRIAEVLDTTVESIFKRKKQGPVERAGRTIELAGKVYGDLEVISKIFPGHGSEHGEAFWRCRCRNCGQITTVRSDHLRSGKVKTCECKKRNANNERKTNES